MAHTGTEAAFTQQDLHPLQDMPFHLNKVIFQQLFLSNFFFFMS